MKRIILHIDMNSYFASVEQQANPFLRGKPLGVCAYLSPNGAIIASSIEAKKLGITVGTRVREALEIEPNLLLVENEPAKYRSTTQAIFSILNEYANKLEPYSIDEAFLDLTGQVKTFRATEAIARDIQARIKIEVGEWLRSSVGIAPTRWLAKFASDVTEPDSVHVLRRSQLDQCYRRVRELQAAWGINVAMESRLQALGITNLLELKNYPLTNIMRVLGRMGYYLWANVNGIELSTVSQPAPPKSVGHSYQVPRRTTDRTYHERILMKLCERVGRRMRKQRLEAKSIYLYVGQLGARGFSANRRWHWPLYDGWEIFNAARLLLKEADMKKPVTGLAVSVSRLQPISGQLEIFKRRREPRNLVRALDTLNNKYGEFTVMRGRMFGTEKNAHDRVGYRKTVPLNELFKPPELEVDTDE